MLLHYETDSYSRIAKDSIGHTVNIKSIAGRRHEIEKRSSHPRHQIGKHKTFQIAVVVLLSLRLINLIKNKTHRERHPNTCQREYQKSIQVSFRRRIF